MARMARMDHELEDSLSLTSSASRRVAATLLAGLSALALGACGGSDSGVNGASASENDRETARLKLNQCLRDNGIDLPDNPGQAGSGPQQVQVDRDKVRQAMEGPCKKLQQAAFGNPTAEERQERDDAFQKFAQCMRDNGVDLPDIPTGGGGGPTRGTVRIDRDDPDVRAAQEKCQDLMPRGGGLRFAPGPGAR